MATIVNFQIGDEATGPSGQNYVLLKTEPYQRPSGEMSTILTWRSVCRVCGAPFECKSGPTSHGAAVHCPEHRLSRDERTRFWLASLNSPAAAAKRKATIARRRLLKALL